MLFQADQLTEEQIAGELASLLPSPIPPSCPHPAA